MRRAVIQASSVPEWVQKAKEKAHIIRSFLPVAVSRDTSIPQDQVIRECLELADQGHLEVSYEADCPICFSTLLSLPRPRATTADCIFCSHDEIEVEEDNFRPRFSFPKRGM